MKHEINKRFLAAAFSFFVLPNSIYSHLLPTPTQTPLDQLALFDAPVAKKTIQVPDKKIVKPRAKTLVIAPIELENWFNQYAQVYGVAVETLKSIAKCESGFNPNASNGKYFGLFQFAPSTWTTNRIAMGLDSDVSLRANPGESIRTAAYKIGRDGTSAWSSCAH